MLILKFLLNLPQLAQLFFHLEKQVQDAEEKRKVSDDLKKINKAFREKDKLLLRDTFNSD